MANSAVATRAAFCASYASCRPLAQLDVSVGFRSLAVGLGPLSELTPPAPVFALPAVEHPTLQSFVLFAGEIASTSNRPPQGGGRIAVYVVLRSLPRRLLVVPRFHLSLLPLHRVSFWELGTILEGTEPALVVGASMVWAFLLMHALRL